MRRAALAEGQAAAATPTFSRKPTTRGPVAVAAENVATCTTRARYPHASTGGSGIPPTISSGWQSRPWPDPNRRTRFCRPLPDLPGGPRLRVLHVLYPVGGEACDSLAGQSLPALRHLVGLPSRCRPVGGASLGLGRLPGVGTVEQGDARVRGQTVRTCARRRAENGPASRVLAVPAGRHSTTHWYPGSGKVTT